MQKLAAWALFSGPSSEEGCIARHAEVRQLVDEWLRGKGTLREATFGVQLVLKDGRKASYEEVGHGVAHGSLVDIVLVEPSGDATFRSQVSIGISDNRVIVYVELQAEGVAYRLAPTVMDIRPPILVGNLIAAFEDWQCGACAVTTRPSIFRGQADAEVFRSGLFHKDRNLPVVALSSYEGRCLTDSLADELANDLAGVALVVTVDEDCSWHLTAKQGKEWSVFSGAIRLYWPGIRPDDYPFKHPLWVPRTLLARDLTASEAAAKLRTQLRQQLLAISAFSVPEPAAFAHYRQSNARERLE